MRLCIRNSKPQGFEVSITNDSNIFYDYCLYTELPVSDEVTEHTSNMEETLSVIARIMKQTGTNKNDYHIISNSLDDNHLTLSKFIRKTDNRTIYYVAWLLFSMYALFYVGIGAALWIKYSHL